MLIHLLSADQREITCAALSNESLRGLGAPTTLPAVCQVETQKPHETVGNEVVLHQQTDYVIVNTLFIISITLHST